MGFVYSSAYRFDEAIVELEKSIQLDPGNALARAVLGYTFMHKSLYAHAIEELQRAVDLSHSASSIIASLAEAHAASGNHHQAQKILEELEHVSKQRYVTPYPIARIYMALGKKEETFRWLENAYAEHAAMMFFLKTDPRFIELKSEPRFLDLLRRMNFPSS